MTHAKRLWSIWQALLSAFAWAFTGPSFRRFAEWVTAMAINGEEHTITQSVLALERPADWKALESFAEYGAWHPDYVTASLTRLVETAPGRLWHGYHISAVDDTKVHRNSPDVWGTCTFHEYTARCPNRAPTVRAHNWVVLGALLDNPGQPPWCLPLSGRLYFRKSQLPLQSQDSDHTVVFRTKWGVIAPVPGIMRLFWAFSSSNPPESPSQEDSSLANMLDTLEARCRSDGPPAGPRSIDPLPGSRSFLTVSAVA